MVEKTKMAICLNVINIYEIKKRKNKMNKFQQLLGSRKFWAAMIGLILIIVKVFRPDFPLEAEELTNIVYVLIAYIMGTGIEDGLTNNRNIK